jgi:hypothetical protein
MSRLDQYDVSVSIDGTNYGTFDKMTGGDIDSEELKYKPGAMQTEISLGGPASIEITLRFPPGRRLSARALSSFVSSPLTSIRRHSVTRLCIPGH